jgi:hypothetical protein
MIYAIILITIHAIINFCLLINFIKKQAEKIVRNQQNIYVPFEPPKSEEQKSMDRINRFLKRNELTIEDLQKIILLTLGDNK